MRGPMMRVLSKRAPLSNLLIIHIHARNVVKEIKSIRKKDGVKLAQLLQILMKRI